MKNEVVFVILLFVTSCHGSDNERVKKQFLAFADNNNNVGGFGLPVVGGGEEIESFMNPNTNNDILNGDSRSFGELGASRYSEASFDGEPQGQGVGGEGLSELSSFMSQASQPLESQQNQMGVADSTADFPSESSLLSGLEDGFSNNNNNEILSGFNNDPFEKKLESSVNLGDTLEQGQSSPVNRNSKDSTGDIDNLLTSLGFNTAASNPQKERNNQHDTGDGREGIGNKMEDMQELLQNELGQLDNADEKLQKMLESGIDSDSSNFVDSNQATGNIMSPASDMMGGSVMMDSAQSQMNQMTNQYPDSASSFPDNTYPGEFSPSDELNPTLEQQQQSAMNQLSGTMTQNSVEGIQPITIHAHASDKSSKQNHKPSNPEVSKNLAAQVQQDARVKHEQKLFKLKKRLQALREKLAQLEDEQAKKSTSNTNDESPKASRNNAIKRLLIKNLKLAAMIATKEIQLEEARGRTLDYLSGKKDDNANRDVENESLTTSPKESKDEEKNKTSHSLTELSRKAEEEVNHLIKTQPGKKQSSKLTNTTNIITDITRDSLRALTGNKSENGDTSLSSASLKSKNNTDFISKINETLQILDKSANWSKNDSSNSNRVLSDSSKRFLNTLQTTVTSLPPDKAQDVQEKALATLYNAMKVKAAESAKKRDIFLKPYIVHKPKNDTMTT